MNRLRARSPVYGRQRSGSNTGFTFPGGVSPFHHRSSTTFAASLPGTVAGVGGISNARTAPQNHRRRRRRPSHHGRPLHRLPTPPRSQVAPALHYLDLRHPIRIPTHLLPPSTLAAAIHHLVPRCRPPSTLACARPPRSSRLLHVCRLIPLSPGVSRHRAAPRRARLVPLRPLLHVRRGAGGEAPTNAMSWRFCSGNPALLAADTVEVEDLHRLYWDQRNPRSDVPSSESNPSP